jgi:hypothetical protein
LLSKFDIASKLRPQPVAITFLERDSNPICRQLSQAFSRVAGDLSSIELFAVDISRENLKLFLGVLLLNG